MTISVVITTYCPEVGHPRGAYLIPVLASLMMGLAPSHELMRFVVAVDGYEHMPQYDTAVDMGAEISYGPRGGIGASLNRVVSNLYGPEALWLYTTDDWKLTATYDLTQSVRLIRDVGYDYVRLGPPHPNVAATIMFQEGIGWWLSLHSDKGGFSFATRPFLASKSFYYQVGPFKEQCDSYVCERDYSDRVARLHGPRMAEVVNGSFEGPWEHVGEVSVGSQFP